MTENERRLQREHMKLTNPDDSIEDMGTVRFYVTCQGNSYAILERAKHVMILANESAQKYGDWDERWLSVFPTWFLDACDPELPREERQKETNKIQQLPWDQKIKIIRNLKWSVLEWTSWILPENRIWIWWGAECLNENTIVVAVEVTDWPFPSDNLSWLFRACGAVTVEAEI